MANTISTTLYFLEVYEASKMSCNNHFLNKILFLEASLISSECNVVDMKVTTCLLFNPDAIIMHKDLNCFFCRHFNCQKPNLYYIKTKLKTGDIIQYGDM